MFFARQVCWCHDQSKNGKEKGIWRKKEQRKEGTSRKLRVTGIQIYVADYHERDSGQTLL